MPTLISTGTITTYRKRSITTQNWKVNGIKRTVYAVDNDTTAHFDTIEDAQRFIRRRN